MFLLNRLLYSPVECPCVFTGFDDPNLFCRGIFLLRSLGAFDTFLVRFVFPRIVFLLRQSLLYQLIDPTNFSICSCHGLCTFDIGYTDDIAFGLFIVYP